MREVLTYSRRGSRFTPSQQEAWDAHADAGGPRRGGRRPRVLLAERVRTGGTASWRSARASARPRRLLAAPSVVRRPGVRGLAARGRPHPRPARPRPGPTTYGCSGGRRLVPGAPVRAGAVEELWTFFPDPWPKKRHHKRRLVNPGVRALAAPGSRPVRDLAAGHRLGRLRRPDAHVLDAEPQLVGGRVERWKDRPVTKFERKGSRPGRHHVPGLPPVVTGALPTCPSSRTPTSRHRRTTRSPPRSWCSAS